MSVDKINKITSNLDDQEDCDRSRILDESHNGSLEMTANIDRTLVPDKFSSAK